MFENEYVQKVLLWLGGILTTALGWFAKKQIDRIEVLEKNTVTKTEFVRAIDNIEKAASLMHGQNQEVLNRIDKRVDDLYKLGTKNGS